MARLEDITNKPSRLAAGRRAGKQQQQPAAGASPQPAAPEPAVAADPHTQPPQPQSEQLSLELEDVDELLRSFRRLDFEPCEQQLADEQQQQAPPLSQQDSPASTATASSSRLGSPLAAFAAAKARLARSNSDAGSLISATLQRLGRPEPAPDASTPTAPPARSKPLGGLDASLLARAPQVQLQQAGAAATATALDLVQQQQRGVGNPLLQHQRQRSTLLLKERLRSTMQLCESLHEQNQANITKMVQLVCDNQRLSRSLHEARLDKEALQSTIRQLTKEAALLAEQARAALLPSATPQLPRRPASAPPTAAVVPVRTERGLGLVRDWSLAAVSEASSSCDGSCASRGAAWQPCMSVRSFHCGGCGPATAAYARGSSEDAGDKRRRLAPGMLAHCLRPVVAAAVAEAAEMDAATARLGTPSRTPKRKLRPAAAVAEASPAAAPVPVVQQPEAATAAAAAIVVAPAGKQAAPMEQEQQNFLTFELFEAKWHGAGAGKAPASKPLPNSSHGPCSIM